MREACAPPIAENTRGLKISGYVTAEVVLRDDIDTREAVMLAIKAAEPAQYLYLDLAAKANDAAVRVVLWPLAVEHTKRKLVLETEYDGRVFAPN